jgi:hypothetical protein
MPRKKTKTVIKSIRWRNKPEKHNYPAALSLLSLIMEPEIAEKIVKDLERGEIAHFKAKDIFRMSRESLLGISNSHVLKDQMKIDRGEKLSPILLVRDLKHARVVIADGYHRLCAVYHYDEDALIPCKLA